jgi:hypothetical protein
MGRNEIDDANDLNPLDIESSELLKEQTLMLPVAYNTAAGPHGRGFVRFPEELNGPGCFGTVFLWILNGSGYSLKWASFQTEFNFDINSEPNYSSFNGYDKTRLRSEKHDQMDICGCAHVQDPNIMNDLIGAMKM